MIQYIAEDVKLPPLQKLKLNRWIKDTAAEYDRKTGDIAYLFCNDARILEVNKQYLNHDYFTDIITFDYGEGRIISGDIFISIDTIQSNAEEYQVAFITELHRIMIHGILHLCGQNDKMPDEKKIMTEKENRALQRLSEY